MPVALHFGLGNNMLLLGPVEKRVFGYNTNTNNDKRQLQQPVIWSNRRCCLFFCVSRFFCCYLWQKGSATVLHQNPSSNDAQQTKVENERKSNAISGDQVRLLSFLLLLISLLLSLVYFGLCICVCVCRAEYLTSQRIR